MVDDRCLFFKGTTFGANFKQLCLERAVARMHNKEIDSIFKNRALMVATIDENIPLGRMDIGMSEPNCLGSNKFFSAMISTNERNPQSTN
jgi:hypothetical protein